MELPSGMLEDLVHHSADVWFLDTWIFVPALRSSSLLCVRINNTLKTGCGF